MISAAIYSNLFGLLMKAGKEKENGTNLLDQRP